MHIYIYIPTLLYRGIECTMSNYRYDIWHRQIPLGARLSWSNMPNRYKWRLQNSYAPFTIERVTSSHRMARWILWDHFGKDKYAGKFSDYGVLKASDHQALSKQRGLTGHLAIPFSGLEYPALPFRRH